jgi:hypothetical protein
VPAHPTHTLLSHLPVESRLPTAGSLSPSSGSLAGQSDCERGGQASCIASSLGLLVVPFVVCGFMPRRLWPSVHPSCAARSEVMLLPLAHRWSEAGMGGQHLASSSPNKLEASAPDLVADGRRSPFWFCRYIIQSLGRPRWRGREGVLPAGCWFRWTAGKPNSFRQRDLELFQADGCFAIAIHCRSDGKSSTSGVEAITLPDHGSSKPVHHEVIRSPRRSGGPCPRLVVRRGLPSCRPLFLGGDALRTPTRGGGGAQGLDCRVSFSSGVLVVKRSAFFVVWAFPRARLQRMHLYHVPTFLI